MPFSSRKFGVEIEYTGVSRTRIRELLTTAGIPTLDHEGRNGSGGRHGKWSVVYDGSVSDCEENGGEVVSPILSGMEGLEEVIKVAKIISQAGGRANRSCGLHVHVDAGDIGVSELKTIARRYARFETEIDNFMPASRRANNNNFCYSMINNGILNEIQRITSKRQFYNTNRYFKLNLNSIQRHGTIEFRQHSGSTNSTKISNWIKFCVSFVEQSLIVHRTIENFIPTPEAPVAEVGNDETLSEDVIAYSDSENETIRIVDRTRIGTHYFVGSSDSGGVRYNKYTAVFKALLFGVSINGSNEFSATTARKVILILKNRGIVIRRRWGQNFIIETRQPARVFTSSALSRAGRIHSDNEYCEDESQTAQPAIMYTNDIDDSLFNGIEQELVSFYQERVVELAG